MRKVEGKNGGTLIVREKGDPPVSGAGRPKNPFKDKIREFAEADKVTLELTGYVIGPDGMPTDQQVRVMVPVPSVLAVVRRMFAKAAKGNVPAAKWLTETGYGKELRIGEDPDNPLGAGFVLVLPENKR